ncbi:type II RES/Xre toxin-antitoxin system antitoxin [Marinobacter mobilis]|uniref:type II RES/Xre toxin-antitoxin system antitoxin n=1 Tax=Marinobacter mobilis TaxID=488533 RepID=UPI0035C669FF
MNTSDEVHEDKPQTRLRARKKAPRVFTPGVIHVTQASLKGTENPESFFIKIVGVSGKLAEVNVGDVIKRGVSASSLYRIKSALKINNDELLEYFDISRATFIRRTKGKSKLTRVETDRVYRYSRLMALATNMFHGDKEEALRWLKNPAYAFKGETPLEHARTEFGAHEVETLIGRIEHGIAT